MDQLKDLLQADMLADINISLLTTFYSLFASMLSSLVLRYLYIRYGRSMNNREYFGNIFILLSVTTCCVIIIVKYSLALSLGLVGALSIVRFRAAIKEPEELVFLFLVIAFGLAFGANQFAVGFMLLATAACVIIFSASYFSLNNGLDHTGTLVIISGDRQTIEETSNGELRKLMDMTSWAVLKEMNLEGDLGRLVIKCSTSTDSQEFVNEVRQLCSKNKIDFNCKRRSNTRPR